MLRTAIAVVLVAAATVAAAANTETRAELSQAKARTVLDQAVEANGGAEALRAVEVVRLRLEGQTFPRLQMTTPAPPFEGGTLRRDAAARPRERTACASTRSSAASASTATTRSRSSAAPATPTTTARRPSRRSRRSRRPSSSSSSTTAGCRTCCCARRSTARTRCAISARTTSRGGAHEVITFVMPDTQQVALYVDAATGLVSKYELIFVDSLEGVEASEIIFGDYQKVGNYQVPRRWTNRQLGEDQTRYTVKAEFNPPVTDDSFRVAAAGYARGEAGADRARGEGRPARRRRLRDPERRRPEPEHAGGRLRRLRRRRRGAGLERRRRCRDQAHPRAVPGQADPLRRHDAPPRRPHRRHAQLHRRGRDGHHHGGQPAGDRGDGGLAAERPPRHARRASPSSCCSRTAAAC